MTPESQIQIARDSHEQWLKHPVTQMLLQNLKNHKQTFVDSITINAGNQNIPDNTFRQLGTCIKTVDAIQKSVLEFDLFLKLNTTK